MPPVVEGVHISVSSDVGRIPSGFGRFGSRRKQVPKTIDDFIDESLGMSGMSESMGHRDGSAREGVLWGALLLEAKTNCTQAEANEELSHNLLMCFHSVFGTEGTIDLEPDRLGVMVCRAG